jgi:hypothetical protein
VDVCQRHPVLLNNLPDVADMISGYQALMAEVTTNLQAALAAKATPPWKCPVCFEPGKEKWAVIGCGHCICPECWNGWVVHAPREITCPTCRVVANGVQRVYDA